MLKFLKEECDDELVLVFLNSISFSILNAPWDSMDEIFGGTGSEKDGPRNLFLGNFIQLLCSFVEQFSFAEGLDDSVDKQAILSKIINLLLHFYFEDLLCHPSTESENQDDCLEGSPFMLSYSDGEVHDMQSGHLQRQAVYLFLRCSSRLINPAKDTSKHYPSYAISELSCYGREKGLSDLHSWLSRHVPVDELVPHETYWEKSINFSSSLLKLYIHEISQRKTVTSR
ncbi:Detected protein of confused Function [Hibiscus syriacus]|uniref:Detected protein of confused Function n=1 Tax=Hibiscus syriacus TaxID=106335 RepID=A0A6A3ALQ7_HIBSY|nr:Detected protein of confused Function [Hibiscus syriacus]